ncbi:MAG: 1-acyl-sn-glycerol-3-phosphate acyltransferase [Chitinophagaceae bacterium]|nr:1-acyl-sn-glycerol-3-phosphate acyltransferase [Chitinophagaceae bacterium]
MEKFFSGIYHFFLKRRGLLFVIFFACLGAAAFFTTRLRFEEDISKILPEDEKVEKLNEIFRQSKFMDKLVMMISLKDTAVTAPDSLVSFADDMTAGIEQTLSSYIKKINYRVNDDMTLAMLDMVQDHLPSYLTGEDYERIDSLTAGTALKETLRHNLQTLSSPAGYALKNIIANDPVGISFIALKKLQQLQYDENFELYDNCVVTKDQKTLLFFITPAYPPDNTGKNELFLQGLDSLIAQKAISFPWIDAAYFGATAVSAGNAAQLSRDTLFTQGITVLFLVVFIALYFRRKSAPLLVMIPVVFGALFGLAMIFFIKGSISVIAVGTGSVILGIAVNYSLHVFNHYRHTLSIEKVITDLAFPLTLGGITTIGGFFCLNFAASDMLKDLGLFAGFSLIGASLSSLIFLPHFIRKEKTTLVSVRHHSWLDRLASLRPDHNKYLIAGIAAITIVLAFYAGKVGFETDMSNMSFMPEKLQKAEKRLNAINEAALQSVYMIAEGKNLEEALVQNEKLAEQVEKLREKGMVNRYSGVSVLLLSDSLQKERIQRWQTYWTPQKKNEVLGVLKKEGMAMGYSETAFDRFASMLNKAYAPADTAAMAELQKAFLDDYVNEQANSTSIVTLLKVSPENKPAIYQNFENKPGVTVIDRQYLTRKLVDLINVDFSTIALITSLFVFAVLLITYGRIELALMAFLPMFISWIWILGIMALAGIKFNIINIIVSTLIFGLGDDYGIFIMDGLLQEYKTGKKNLASFKSSILLSAITTITGLGVLIFAKHPALRSIAAISVIGIACVVLIAQVCIPFLFSMLIKNRTQKKLFPWTFFGWLKSMFANLWFILGSMVLVVIGIFLVKLRPFGKQKGRDLFHVVIQKFSRSLIYIMGNVKKTIINPQREDFSKPAIIICNHQSGLDNFLVMMLHPRLILFTNDRVRSAPISGLVVQMADYYSASAGVESSMPLLAEKVKQGYSVVLFPEGTRSASGDMKRFHKGAFFLAEKLNLDILPVIIHGSGYTMTKHDMLVKDGSITLKILPRIHPGDNAYGNGYAERAKRIGSYFRSEYDGLRALLQQPVWYKEQLFYNYIYKGPVLEWYMRVKVRLEKNYEPFHKLLPERGKILDIGCGYGFMSYMLHFASPGRDFTGVDYDEEKITVANHCFSRDEGIRFRHADVLNYHFEKYDAVIAADMLHYLPENRQVQVIKQCADALNPGGILIVRDGNKDLEERHRGTRMTEFFSTRFTGFNKVTNEGLSFLSGSTIHNLAKECQLECREIDDTRFTSNIIFVLSKKSIHAGEAV